jgi:hypothetical protein
MLAATIPTKTQPKPMTMEVAVVAPQYALGTLGPVLLQLWELDTPIDGARKARELARTLHARGYEQTISLIVVPEQSQLPSEAARKEVGYIPKDLPGCLGLALVREGEGFRAAAVRAIMTGMMAFGQAAPYKIVASVAEGCDWLSKRMPSIQGADIQRAKAELHRAWQDAR